MYFTTAFPDKGYDWTSFFPEAVHFFAGLKPADDCAAYWRAQGYRVRVEGPYARVPGS
jgi:hypothetical protein